MDRLNLEHARPDTRAAARLEPETGLQPVGEESTETGIWPLRPALFARYRDLDALRHPYPMVLVRSSDEGSALRPLTSVMNDALKAKAPPGSEGEAMRQNVLRLETAIRRRVSAGEKGTLANFWSAAAAAELKARGEAPFGPMDTEFDRVREALAVDGPLIGCDERTPSAVMRHVWKRIHRERARAFRKKVEALILRLADILKADYAKSDDAHDADRLRVSVGRSDADNFDFHAWSRVLVRLHPEERLHPDRRHRIEWALLTLKSQRFYGPGRASERKPGQPEPHRYIFESCTDALGAFRQRLPEVLEFVKALTVAELEVENAYDPAVHGPVIEAFDESDLTAEQLALLPAPLVCLRDGKSANAEIVRAFEALASGLPFKVLIQTDDILGTTRPEPPKGTFGGGSTSLASMAMGLGNAFALQVTSAHLHTVADALERGLRHDGPALFCIYSGATPTAEVASPYLLAAAATESRTFPTFCFDPSAGRDLAHRFSLEHNPQVRSDWPEHELEYETDQLQRVQEKLAFTTADFALCDSRYRRFFHPRRLNEQGVARAAPAGEWLALDETQRDQTEPWVPAIDEENRLYRVFFDEKVAVRAWNAREGWARMQELAGIGNSHVEQALAELRRKAAAEAADGAAASANAASGGAQPAASPEPPPEPVPAEEPQEAAGAAASSDDGMPWIETARCTTCNECTQINNKMFAYNDDGQAYIADPHAGSYRELVEAAESCQVSIIHPGKPLDPNEPDLEDLIERAAEFN